MVSNARFPFRALARVSRDVFPTVAIARITRDRADAAPRDSHAVFMRFSAYRAVARG
jgi:hypothetical protein